MCQRAQRRGAGVSGTATAVATVATVAAAIAVTPESIIIGWVVAISFGESQRAVSIITLELPSEFLLLLSLLFVRDLLGVVILVLIFSFIFVVILFIRVFLHGRVYKRGGAMAGFTRLITIVAKSILIGRVFGVILHLVITKCCIICCSVYEFGLKAKRFPLHEGDVDGFEGQVLVAFDPIRFCLVERSSMDKGALVFVSGGSLPCTITSFYRENGGLNFGALMCEQARDWSSKCSGNRRSAGHPAEGQVEDEVRELASGVILNHDMHQVVCERGEHSRDRGRTSVRQRDDTAFTRATLFCNSHSPDTNPLHLVVLIGVCRGGEAKKLVVLSEYMGHN